MTEVQPLAERGFYRRKPLVPPDVPENYMEVTEKFKADWEAADHSEPPQWLIMWWNAAVGKYGRYNPETRLFELNGLTDITTTEALHILMAYTEECLDSDNSSYFMNFAWRTQIPMKWNTPTQLGSIFRSSKVTHARLSTSGSILVYNQSMGTTMFSTIRGFNSPIVKWLDEVTVFGSDNASLRGTISCFCSAPALEYFRFKYVNSNVDIGCSPLVGLDSLEYLVANRLTGDNAIDFTVTVHANVYAKLTGDTTNSAAASLTPEELAQWSALLDTAADRNIRFSAT